MNRQQYHITRRLVRDNGGYALKWMPTAHQLVWSRLFDIQAQRDRLQDKVHVPKYCWVPRLVCA
jgi:hypothetical protein